jgi:hypothetical protein
MRHTAERTARDLAQIADRATPSSNAWASIQSRIKAQANEADSEVIMLEVENDEKEGPNRTLLGLAAAAAVVLVVGIGVFVSLDDGDPTDLVVAEAPDTDDEAANSKAGVSPVPTTQAQSESGSPAVDDVAFLTADAEVIVAAWFEASNGPDSNQVIALLAPDAPVTSEFFGEVTRDLYERMVAWNAAQGVQYSAPECVYVEGGEFASLKGRGTFFVSAECVSETVDALSQVLEKDGVATVVQMILGPDGIQGLSLSYGDRDFLYLGTPFEDWVAVNHPGDGERMLWGETIAESVSNGLLRRQYATEWAAFLDEQGCEFSDRCLGDATDEQEGLTDE